MLSATEDKYEQRSSEDHLSHLKLAVGHKGGGRKCEERGDSMTSLSDQQPGSSFSEYSELFKVSAQSWDWQQPEGMDMSTSRGLVVSDGPLATVGLADEDKLYFFDQPGQRTVTSELKVLDGGGCISNSSSVCIVSLGSTGESPDSPLSSSPSPSPASRGRFPSALGCGGGSRVSLQPVPASPAKHMELSFPTSTVHLHTPGFSLMVDEDSPSEPWSKSSFPECHAPGGPKLLRHRNRKC